MEERENPIVESANAEEEKINASVAAVPDDTNDEENITAEARDGESAEPREDESSKPNDENAASESPAFESSEENSPEQSAYAAESSEESDSAQPSYGEGNFGVGVAAPAYAAESAKTEEAEAEQNDDDSEYIRMEKLIEEREAKRRRNAARRPLIFSLVGMLLSVFGGIGLPLSIAGTAMAAARLRSGGGSSAKWALVLGICGIIMNSVMIISMWLVGLVSPATENPDVSGSSIGSSGGFTSRVTSGRTSGMPLAEEVGSMTKAR